MDLFKMGLTISTIYSYLFYYVFNKKLSMELSINYLFFVLTIYSKRR